MADQRGPEFGAPFGGGLQRPDVQDRSGAGDLNDPVFNATLSTSAAEAPTSCRGRPRPLILTHGQIDDDEIMLLRKKAQLTAWPASNSKSTCTSSNGLRCGRRNSKSAAGRDANSRLGCWAASSRSPDERARARTALNPRRLEAIRGCGRYFCLIRIRDSQNECPLMLRSALLARKIFLDVFATEPTAVEKSNRGPCREFWTRRRISRRRRREGHPCRLFLYFEKRHPIRN